MCLQLAACEGKALTGCISVVRRQYYLSFSSIRLTSKLSAAACPLSGRFFIREFIYKRVCFKSILPCNVCAAGTGSAKPLVCSACAAVKRPGLHKSRSITYSNFTLFKLEKNSSFFCSGKNEHKLRSEPNISHVLLNSATGGLSNTSFKTVLTFSIKTSSLVRFSSSA